MQIPYEVTARPDTGLYNAKLGIWLFLASEVMLFGGLFSAYIFLRIGTEPGYWPPGLLHVPIGTMNTFVLILSSVTVVMAWASLKMRKYKDYVKWMIVTIVCLWVFLLVKVTIEYPHKFHHFGAFIQKDKREKYNEYLANDFMEEQGRPPRVEITGHLHGLEVDIANADKAALQQLMEREGYKFAESHGAPHGNAAHGDAHAAAAPHGEIKHIEFKESHSPGEAEKIARIPGLKVVAFDVQLDQANADPRNPENLRPRFWPPKRSDKTARIELADVDSWSAFVPKHSTYFATYFMITGLHGAHVLGGAVVFMYMLFTGGKMYRRNPEHLANRIEVAGLFWHFVDLVWIFVFPLFYLL